MAKLKTVVVEVSNQRPLTTLLILMLGGALALKWAYASFGSSGAILGCYAGTALLCLWAHMVTKANKRKEKMRQPKQ